MLKMTIAYIAHPIGGDVENNLADLRRIIKKINLEQPHTVPFCPYYADIVSMDDDIPEHRERGIKNDTCILESGVCDEIWLTGDHVSNGMAAEVAIAKNWGIHVIDKINKL